MELIPLIYEKNCVYNG